MIFYFLPYLISLPLVFIVVPSCYGQTCDSGGGQGWCSAGLCCSSYSWCGTGDAWCGTGCQNGYGSCSSLSSTYSLPGPAFFDGTNYLYYPSLTTALGYTFSISLWITPQAIPSSSVLISLGRSSTNINGEFVVTMLSSGKINYWEYNNGYGYGISMTTPSILNTGVRTHVVIVRDGRVGALYIDGVVSTTNTANIPNGIIIRNGDLAFGKDYRDGINFYQGSIDNVNIYLTALMDAQITNIYQQHLAPTVSTSTKPSTSAGPSMTVPSLTLSDSPSAITTAMLTAPPSYHLTITPYTAVFSKPYLLFSGKNFYLYPSIVRALNSTFSISVWIATTSYPASIVSLGRSPSSSQQGEFVLELTKDGDLHFWDHSQSTGPGFSVLGGNIINYAGSRVHIALTRNGREYSLYLNGQPSAHSISTVSVVYQNSYLVFGLDHQNNSNYFKGTMDHIAIYSQTLSESDVYSLYSANRMFIPAPNNDSDNSCDIFCIIAIVTSVVSTIAAVLLGAGLF